MRARSVVFASASLLGSAVIATTGFVLSGCEDELPPSFDFSLDGGVLQIDAARADASGPPPETKLTVTPNAVSNQANATFEFTSTQPGRFACRIDGGPPAECTSPHSVPVTEGSHTFEVTAVSANGVDATPESFTWKVDLTPPVTTITSSPPSADNSASVTFAFTVSEPATTNCALDTNAAAPCTSPFEVRGLTEGAHTFTITTTDRAGNMAAAPATHSWNVDLSTPDTVINTGPTGPVNATSATFTFSSPGAGAGAKYACSLGTAAFTDCDSPKTYGGLADGEYRFRVRVTDSANNQDITPAERNWTVDTVAPTATITAGPAGPTNDTTPTFTFTTAGGATSTECHVDTAAFSACTSPFTTGALLNGAHTFEVRAVDAANNKGTPASRSFTVDTVAPTVNITSGPTGATNDSTPTFGFSAGGGATATQCRVDAAAFAPCTSTFTPASALSEAAHTFEVRSVDAAGNTSAVASRSFTVDTTPPTVSIAGGPSGAINDTTPGPFTFSTGGGATGTQCRFDAAGFAACTSPFTATAALSTGAHTFEVRSIDAAGNYSNPTATRAFTIDTTPPTVSITGGPTGAINDPTPGPFTFTTGGGATSTQCRFDSAGFAPCASPFTATAALSSGAHTFEVRSIDAAGNISNPTATRGFTIDTVAPVVTLADPAYEFSYPWTLLTFFFSVSETSSVQYRFCNKPDFALPCTPSGAFTAWSSPYTMAPPGTGSGYYYMQIRATDAAGNFGDAFLDFSTNVITQRFEREKLDERRTPPAVRWTLWAVPPASRGASRDDEPFFVARPRVRG